MIVSGWAWPLGASQASVPGPVHIPSCASNPIRIPAPAAGFPKKFWRTGWPTPRQPAKSQGEHCANVRIDANGRAPGRGTGFFGETHSRM